MDWMEEVDWLQLVCWTCVWDLLRWALLSCISLNLFSLHFPSQFLFVVGENCASMQSQAFTVKWPVFKCSRGILLNCSNKLLLIWRCGGGVSIGVQVYTHGKAWALHGNEYGWSHSFCQSIFLFFLWMGLVPNMSNISKADQEITSIQKSSYWIMFRAQSRRQGYSMSWLRVFGQVLCQPITLTEWLSVSAHIHIHLIQLNRPFNSAYC